MDVRGRIAERQQEGDSLTRSLAEHKSAVQASLDQRKLTSALPRAQLVELYTETHMQLQLEETRLLEYRKRIQQLQNKRISKNEAIREHMLLQQHHAKLCTEVQRLQKLAANASKLYVCICQDCV